MGLGIGDLAKLGKTLPPWLRGGGGGAPDPPVTADLVLYLDAQAEYDRKGTLAHLDEWTDEQGNFVASGVGVALALSHDGIRAGVHIPGGERFDLDALVVPNNTSYTVIAALKPDSASADSMIFAQRDDTLAIQQLNLRNGTRDPYHDQRNDAGTLVRTNVGGINTNVRTIAARYRRSDLAVQTRRFTGDTGWASKPGPPDPNTPIASAVGGIPTAGGGGASLLGNIYALLVYTAFLSDTDAMDVMQFVSDRYTTDQ